MLVHWIPALTLPLLARSGHVLHTKDPGYASGVCTVVPDKDGGDDSGAVIEAFKTCGHAGRVVFPPNQTYHIEQVMNTTGLSDCTVDLHGYLLVCDLLLYAIVKRSDRMISGEPTSRTGLLRAFPWATRTSLRRGSSVASVYASTGTAPALSMETVNCGTISSKGRATIRVDRMLSPSGRLETRFLKVFGLSKVRCGAYAHNMAPS